MINNNVITKNIDDNIEYRMYSCSENNNIAKTTTLKASNNLITDSKVVIVLYLCRLFSTSFFFLNSNIYTFQKKDTASVSYFLFLFLF